MVFKRRDRRSLITALREFIWPRGGWARAFYYVKHRLHRLPGTPEFIARGIWAGVFTSFTPFYGLHFLIAAFFALILRGSFLAALMATFFGNPLTYVPIAIVSLTTGHWMLGTRPEQGFEKSLGETFVDAGRDLWDNFLAIFTSDTADWHRLAVFWDEVCWPWLVGGVVPGIVAGTICYYLSVPVIRAYQNRRKGRLKAKFDELRKKAMTVPKEIVSKDKTRSE